MANLPLSWANSRHRGYRPDAGWIRTPSRLALDPAQYAYLVQATKLGAITGGQMLTWCRLAFEGIAPDWVWRLAASQGAKEVWSSLQSTISSAPPHVSDKWASVVYDSTDRVGHGVRTFTRLAIKKRIAQTRPRQLAGWLEEGFPNTTKVLELRQRFTLRLLLPTARRQLGDDIISEVIAAMQGMGSQALACWLTLLIVKPASLSTFRALAKASAFAHGIKHYVAITKELHTLVRLTQSTRIPPLHLEVKDYQDLLYLNSLAGRFLFATARASDEVYKRQHSSSKQEAYSKLEGWSEKVFDDRFSEFVAKVAAAAAEGKTPVANLSSRDVLAHLPTMGSSGSAPSLRKVKLAIGTRLEPLTSPTKTQWVASLNESKLKALLTAKPTMLAHPIDKLEAGKLKIIMPGDVNHWLVESLALYGAESRILSWARETTLNLTAAEELADMTARMLHVEQELQTIASDYTDYNYNHLYSRMQNLWLAMAAAIDPSAPTRVLWEGQSFSEFSASAARWAAAALEDAWSVVPGDPHKRIKLVQGLWTGWRSTSFINTLFNLGYTEVVTKSFEAMYGYAPLYRQRVLGDDMEGVVQDEWTALRLLELYPRHGFDMNAVKQLVSTTRVEYLRLLYSKSDGVRGSLNRSIAGVVSSDAQKSEARPGPEEYASIYESLGTLISRGADKKAVALLEQASLFYWGHVSQHTSSGRSTVHLPPALAEAANCYGGLGCSDEFKRPRAHLVPLQPSKLNFSRVLTQLPKEVVRLATLTLVERAHAEGLAVTRTDRLIAGLHSSIFISALPATVQHEIQADTARRTAAWYRANKDVTLETVRVPDEVKKAIVTSLNEAAATLEAEGGLLYMEDPQKLADEARSAALGTMAPYEAALGAIKGAADATATVARLGTPRAREKIALLQDYLGREVTNSLLKGTAKIGPPSTRLLHGASRAIMWAVVWAVTTRVLPMLLVHVDGIWPAYSLLVSTAYNTTLRTKALAKYTHF